MNLKEFGLVLITLGALALKGLLNFSPAVAYGFIGGGSLCIAAHIFVQICNRIKLRKQYEEQ